MKGFWLKIIFCLVGLVSVNALADEEQLAKDFLAAAKRFGEDVRLVDCKYYRRLHQLMTCNIASSQPINLREAGGFNEWRFVECKQLRYFFFFDGRRECYYQRPRQTLTLGQNVDGEYYGSIDKK